MGDRGDRADGVTTSDDLGGDPGAESPAEANVDGQPAPVGPTWAHGKYLAVAQEARMAKTQAKYRKARAILDEALDDVSAENWCLVTKVRLCRMMKLSERAVGILLREKLGIKGGLEGLRAERLGLAGQVQLPKEKNVEGAPDLTKWSILDLFDRFMKCFDVIDPSDADEEDPNAVPPGDTRRTWVAWRVFLAAAFGVKQQELEYDHSGKEGDSNYWMPVYPGVVDEAIPRGAAAVPPLANVQTIFERCTGRHTWPETQAKIVSLIVGRRGGKSYITAIIGIYLACCRKYRLKLGTKGMVMILARDKEQAGVIRGYILAFLKTALPGQFAGDPTQKLIELSNGITIEVRAAGEAGTRGYTVVAALMDEIAFWPTDPESAKQDKKVLRALRPAMLGIKNAMIVMLSSPYAQRGELFENHRRAYGKDADRRYFVWQADTLSMRPSDDPDLLTEIAEEYADDPDSAKAEYGAFFRTDLENIFSKAALYGLSAAGAVERPYRKDQTYRAFVDPSGGSSDSYVLAIGHDEVRRVAGEDITVPVLDAIREWVPKFDPQEVSKEVVQICKGYGIDQVTGDAYGGEWPRDPLKKNGLDYVLSEMSRSELYLAFLPVVNSARCDLLDLDHHRRALNQFANLERRVGRSGKDSVDHPPGAHDDVANAIAGVMVGCAADLYPDECVWGEEIY